MGIEQEQQLQAFLWSVLTGCFLGCLYDCIRILRVFSGISTYTESVRRLDQISLPLIGSVRSLRSGRERRGCRLIWLAVGDVSFFCLSGCVFCIFLYHAASGCFRWFYLLGCFIGFFSYYLTIGKLIVLSSETLAFLLEVFLRYLLWVLFLPVRVVYWGINRLLRFFGARILTPMCITLRIRARRRYTRRVRMQLYNLIRFSESELKYD